MIEIKDLKQTCDGYPSQWDFRTETDRPGYARYRWGTLEVSVGRIGQKEYDFMDCVYAVSKKVGEDFDGVIEWSEVLKHLAEVTEEKIVELFQQRDIHLKRMADDPEYRRERIREAVKVVDRGISRFGKKMRKQVKKLLADRTLSKKLGRKLNKKVKRALRKCFRKEKPGKRRDRR